MKKVIIIGGGIAGLSAGIYARQNGFDTEIYEKNPMVGGECTGWDRQGYHIDNCIHWVTGCRPEDEINEIWRNVGAIDDTTELIREPCFYSLEKDGRTLHLWRDLEKTRREFLDAAPEDSAELNRFFDCVKLAECVKVPSRKSLAEMSFFEYMKFGMSMAGMRGVLKEYGKENVGDLANRFRNPHVRAMIGGYFDHSYMAMTLISSYGFYTSGTAAIPAGGSVGMARRISQRYLDLGGRLYTRSAAEKINVSGGKAVSVTFADGSTVACDYVICAADPSVTFGRLLDPKHMDKKLKKMYALRDDYRLTSGFNASFGVIGGEDCGVDTGNFLYPCEAYTVGRQTLDYIGIRMYDYDDTLFPKDKRVIQCNVLQDEADYAYWQRLREDKTRYNEEKLRIAEELRERIIRRFPELEGRLVLLGTYSPVTFTKWCGAYKGAYMSFFQQKGSKSITVKNSIRGLSNVFLASQWLTTNGGLPIAVTSGKFAVDALLKADKKDKANRTDRRHQLSRLTCHRQVRIDCSSQNKL